MAYETNFESVKVFPSWEPVKSDYCSDIVKDLIDYGTLNCKSSGLLFHRGIQKLQE